MLSRTFFFGEAHEGFRTRQGIIEQPGLAARAPNRSGAGPTACGYDEETEPYARWIGAMLWPGEAPGGRDARGTDPLLGGRPAAESPESSAIRCSIPSINDRREPKSATYTGSPIFSSAAQRRAFV